LLGFIDGSKDCVGTVEPMFVGELLGLKDGETEGIEEIVGRAEGIFVGVPLGCRDERADGD